MVLCYFVLFVLQSQCRVSFQYSSEFWSQEVRTGDERIVGGTNAVAVIPYQVVLQTTDNDDWLHYCSGSIISDRHVLTAAHCVVDVLLTELRVLAGTLNRHDGDLHRVIAVHKHPKYCQQPGRALVHDLAVLTVDPPFDVNKPTVQPIAIEEVFVPGNESVTVSGWGLLHQNTSEEVYPSVLQVLHQTTMEHEECNAIWRNLTNQKGPEPFIRKEYELCAHKPMGICAADSGGPLVMRHNNRKILVGVVSTGSAQCGSWAPDIYMRVSAELEFIFKAMHSVF